MMCVIGGKIHRKNSRFVHFGKARILFRLFYALFAQNTMGTKNINVGGEAFIPRENGKISLPGFHACLYNAERSSSCFLQRRLRSEIR
ncbi:hypothetical protein [Methylomicrobium lacus]|uniref:hypothetical protein n=1 Tax=Methylomicrobium lacus TaxID=136992 RepID=UPI0035A98A23